MADTSLLASIIAGQDPLAPEMLNAYRGAQLSSAALDSNFGTNAGPLGALAKFIAGAQGGSMLNNAVGQISSARAASLPEQARIYASPDPFAEIAKGGYSPQTLAQVLAGATPANVEEARLRAAQAGMAANDLAGLRNIQASVQGGSQPGVGPLAGRGGGAISGAAGPLQPTAGPPIGGRLQQPPIAEGAGPMQPVSDPVTVAAKLAPGAPRALLGQNPQQRAIILQRLRALQVQRAAASQPSPTGVPGALQPGP